MNLFKKKEPTMKDLKEQGLILTAGSESRPNLPVPPNPPALPKKTEEKKPEPAQGTGSDFEEIIKGALNQMYSDIVKNQSLIYDLLSKDRPFTADEEQRIRWLIHDEFKENTKERKGRPKS